MATTTTTTMGTPDLPHVSSRGMYATKITFRVLQIIFSITMLAIAGTIVSLEASSLWMLFVAPVTVVSICWALAEGICILARGGHRGIHPGANVALDLLIWLGFTACTALLALVGLPINGLSRGYGGYNGYSSSSYRSGSWYDDSVSSNLMEIAAKGLALVGLGGTLALLHFVTFVIACYETDVRNKKRHTTIIIQQAAPQPGYPGNPVMYGAPPIDTPAPGYGYAVNNYQKA